MTQVVLDASALLAAINDEPGAEVVIEAVSDALMSAVNLAEVIAKLADYGLSDEETRDVLEAFGLEIVPFDEDLAYATGRLQHTTRALGLSLGDRACLALARQIGIPALTSDRAWIRLEAGIEIQVIRE